jgi:hypothetical protein
MKAPDKWAAFDAFFDELGYMFPFKVIGLIGVYVFERGPSLPAGYDDGDVWIALLKHRF